MKKVLTCWLVAFVTCFIAAGCNQDTLGPDSISSGTSSGALLTDCTTFCHAEGSTVAPDPLRTNGEGAEGKHIIHVRERGLDCEKCHLNYADQDSHFDLNLDTGILDVINFDATNTAGNWDLAGRTCSTLDCHGSATLDWYDPSPSLPVLICGDCHTASRGTRRPVLGTNGDFAANTAVVSRHVLGPNDPEDTQCQVCHEMSNHTAGTVRLRHADSFTGETIVFDPQDPSTLEPFCLSCHDDNGAVSTKLTWTGLNPFNDGAVLGDQPYANATRIAASWANPYGHGPNGNHAAEDKLTCLGSGEPGTGCHGNTGTLNAHGSTQQVMATVAFTYDIPGPSQASYDNGSGYHEEHYTLCFNCHAGYDGVRKEDIFGVKLGGILDLSYGPPQSVSVDETTCSVFTHPSGTRTTTCPPYYIENVVTHFADHNVAVDDPYSMYNDNHGFRKNMNLHWYHIAKPYANFRGTSEPGVESTYTGTHCVNCHDVHGSATPHGSLYDEFFYINFTDGLNILGRMRGDLSESEFDQYTSDFLESPPIYCSRQCHSKIYKAWFSPIIEEKP